MVWVSLERGHTDHDSSSVKCTIFINRSKDYWVIEIDHVSSEYNSPYQGEKNKPCQVGSISCDAFPTTPSFQGDSK